MPLPKRRVKLSRVQTLRLINFFDDLTNHVLPTCFSRRPGACPAVCGKAWQFRGHRHACNTLAGMQADFLGLHYSTYLFVFTYILLRHKGILGLHLYFPFSLLTPLRYNFANLQIHFAGHSAALPWWRKFPAEGMLYYRSERQVASSCWSGASHLRNSLLRTFPHFASPVSHPGH